MRARHAPEQWQLVLDAINRDDYELANKLAVKFKFSTEAYKEKAAEGVRHKPLQGDYVAMDPDGKMYCHVIASDLSRHLGLSISYVGSAVPRLERYGGAIKKGKMKGWIFWKE